LGGYGLALAALALVVFGAIECPLMLKFNFKMTVRRKKGVSKNANKKMF